MLTDSALYFQEQFLCSRCFQNTKNFFGKKGAPIFVCSLCFQNPLFQRIPFWGSLCFQKLFFLEQFSRTRIKRGLRGISFPKPLLYIL